MACGAAPQLWCDEQSAQKHCHRDSQQPSNCGPEICCGSSEWKLRDAFRRHPFPCRYGKWRARALWIAPQPPAAGPVASLWLRQGVIYVRDPRPLENPLWTYLTLAVAAIAEGSSLFVAYREFRTSAPQDDGLWPAIRRSKDPSIFAVLFEDAAALLGILAAFLGFSLARALHRPYLDGVASIAIGIILMGTAVLLASETKGLLVGEGARSSTLERICEIVQKDPAVERAGYPLTMYFGPETV